MIKLPIFIFAALFALYLSHRPSTIAVNKNVVTLLPATDTKFVVGDCVQLETGPRENWESPMPIQKIIEIGHSAYRTSYYLDSLSRWSPEGKDYDGTLSFRSASGYLKVTCP